MTNWIFQNVTRHGPRIPIESIDHATELFLGASGENEYAVDLEFFHFPKGALCSTAGPEFGILSYDPNYDHHGPHSLSGFRSATPTTRVTNEPMCFADDTETLSSIDAGQLN